ncbi:hypothetical protein FGIG_11037 [Fasciola gigantica]|uniref:Protein-tyrosine sulfotransferase n=1 Tax=Fasciola gigantica TaxID=46835 RepID=A0A504YK56_FASGI|nr:hypothetical protein FGIG_11037 [Fasciola gigantica]
MIQDCAKLGPNRCIHVRYESLIQHTEQEMRRVLDFLEIPWDPIVLHHEQIKDQLTGLNPYEPSTKQFLLAVHNKSLDAWARSSSPIPLEVQKKTCRDLELLQLLNYCPSKGYLPQYKTIPWDIPKLKEIQSFVPK